MPTKAKHVLKRSVVFLPGDNDGVMETRFSAEEMEGMYLVDLLVLTDMERPSFAPLALKGPLESVRCVRLTPTKEGGILIDVDLVDPPRTARIGRRA